MTTKSPLPVLAKNVPPLPKLAGPVYPLYRSVFAFDGPVAIIPKAAFIEDPLSVGPENCKVSPVKLMGPLPVATTLDPTCCNVTL